MLWVVRKLTSMRKMSLSATSEGGPLPYLSSSVWVWASLSSICSSSLGRDLCKSNGRVTHLTANHSVVQDVCYKNTKSEKNHLNVINQLKGEFFSQFRNSGVTFTVKSAGARIKQVLSTLLDDSHPNKPTTKKEQNKTKKLTGNRDDLWRTSPLFLVLQ